jgi:NTE family protein
VLIKELRMMALLRRTADPGNGEGAQWARMRVHLVRNKIMDTLGYSSKMNAEWGFLTMLARRGTQGRG